MNNKRKNEDDDSECGSTSGVSVSICQLDSSSMELKGNEVDNTGSEKDNGTVMDVLLETSGLQKLEEFPCQVPGCLQFFGTLLDYDTHYNMKHKHSCATCKKTLLSPHFLELHVLESHDTLFELMAERRPMFQCYVETCKEKFTTSKERHNHGVLTHGYHKNFMYSQNPNKILWQQPKGKGNSKQKQQSSGSSKNRSSRNTKISGKSDQMDVEDNSPVTSVKASSTAESNKSEEPASNKEKPHRMHISFGHKATKVFSRKNKFAMKPERNVQPNNVSNLDLDELKTAIEETEKMENENVVFAP